MRQYIPVQETFAEWRKNPKFVAEYDALEEQFALASVFIQARADSGLTQEELAAAMGTTKAVIVRLEGGEWMPSIRMLARFAKATRTKLRISFEPERNALR